MLASLTQHELCNNSSPPPPLSELDAVLLVFLETFKTLNHVFYVNGQLKSTEHSKDCTLPDVAWRKVKKLESIKAQIDKPKRHLLPRASSVTEGISAAESAESSRTNDSLNT